LGMFLAAMIYFLASAISGRQTRTSASLFAMCAFAVLQLLAELSRGIVAYSYPTHDLRLVLIVVFSAGFGVSFSSLIASLFANRRTRLVLAASLAASLVGALAVDGFDQRAASAMLAPMALSAVLLSYRALNGVRRALRFLVISVIFVSANIAFLSYFLDVVFFYLVALHMVALLAERALNEAIEVRRRREAENRADRLELALEQATQADRPVEIVVKGSGRIDRVSTENIVQLRSSDGYTDILTDDGRELTHNESLFDLERQLPVTFIRVHRAHLVNTKHVRSLRRSDQGNGWLILSDSSEVPVSRRIMPSVRRALS
ncbi:MAG: LytTR family DNA-binding domain-containing protein, partial [Pseudomonadota bacterium]